MKIIRIIQNIVIGISLVVLSLLPLVTAFGDESLISVGTWYLVSFIAVFLVMMIRPIADIFPRVTILRKLVFLRKSFGILSASIVAGFVIGKIIAPESQYIVSMFTSAYWSLENYIIFAHIGDITAFVLLITSNNLSMMLLKRNWKRVQKLSYVYFYSGGIYEAYALDSKFAMIAMIMVTGVTVVAFILNGYRKNRL